MEVPPTTPPFLSRAFAVLTTLVLLAVVRPPGACAQTGVVTVLHAFQGGVDEDTKTTAPDGSMPNLGVIEGLDGALYGTASNGGATRQFGTVFRLTLAGDYTKLGDFDYQSVASPLVQAGDGTLYGAVVNQAGGGYDFGGIYSISPNGGFGNLVVSANPRNVIVGQDGQLYGTTGTYNSLDAQGNAVYHPATVFQLQPPGGDLHTLFSFDNTTDGFGDLLQAGDGYIYGVEYVGGVASLFRFGSDDVMVPFHTFTERGVSLIQGRDGSFYAMTDDADGNAVALYQITPAGGVAPLASLEGPGLQGVMQASDGNFYGTTALGGTNNHGTIVQLTPAGQSTTLYSFDDFTVAEGDGYVNATGAYPSGPLFQASDGSIYGTASEGGPIGGGVVFELDVVPAIAFEPGEYDVNRDTGAVRIAVSRRGGTGAASVQYATTPGSATPGVDYTAVSDTLTWDDGDVTDKFIAVPIIDAGIRDGTGRNFSVVLSNPVGAALAAGPQVTVTIHENAQPSPSATITVKTPRITVGGGPVSAVTVSLSAPQNNPVIVTYTLAGTAANGTDYAPLSGSVTFKPHKTHLGILIIPQGDLGGRAKKTLKITLTTGAGYKIGDGQAAKIKIVAAHP